MSTRCGACFSAWESRIEMARNYAAMAASSGGKIAGASSSEWMAKVQGYYDRIRECCANDDEMGQRCAEISDPVERAMCLGLPPPESRDRPEPERRDEPDPEQPDSPDSEQRDEPEPVQHDNPDPEQHDEPQPEQRGRPEIEQRDRSGQGRSQRERPSVADLDEDDAADQTMKILIDLFDHIGLTGASQMVQQVAERANRITVGTDGSYNPYLNIVNLGSSLNERDVDVDDAFHGDQIGTQIEEIAHAYMDLFDHTTIVRLIEVRGRDLYDNAIVQKERLASNPRRRALDPERVFQEAVGEYVSNRINSYFRIRGMLGKFRARGTLTARAFDDARRLYNDFMENRVFGYEKVAGVNWYAVMPLPDNMRRAIDNELLRGQIPDSFDDVDDFRQFAPGN